MPSEYDSLMYDEDTEAFLEHFGVAGMKWGRRKGKSETGVSRMRGAIIDRNARTNDIVEKARSGEKYKLAAAVGKKLIGEEQQKKNWQAHIDYNNAQTQRMKEGKLFLSDRLDMATSISLLELAVRVTPNKK